MNRVGEHPVTAGPLAPRWLAWSLESPRAGVTSTARVSLENAGTATWRSHGADGVRASFHWLDPLGNPIVWDGPRTDAAPRRRPRARRVELELAVTAPRPPGPYRLAFDLVEEHRFWFAEVGASPLELEVEVAPRIAERTLARPRPRRPRSGDDGSARGAGGARRRGRGGAVAVAHLVAGAIPPPDWSRLLLDAHEEGWAAVATAVVPGGGATASSTPWRGGGGRNPRFDHPLLLPSLLDGLEPSEHLGPAGLRRRRGALRRPGRGQTSAAIRSSTDAEDDGAERERDDRLDDEVDEVAGRGNLAEEERRPEALDHGRERVRPTGSGRRATGASSAPGRLSRL